jgi:hypothetical protein
MKTVSRFVAAAAVALALGAVAVAAPSCSMSRAGTRDTSRGQALEMAIESAERERMAHVSMIVETQRRLSHAEDLLDIDAINQLTAEADQEQVTYAHLVHAELALRHELARADVRNH